MQIFGGEICKRNLRSGLQVLMNGGVSPLAELAGTEHCGTKSRQRRCRTQDTEGDTGNGGGGHGRGGQRSAEPMSG